MKAVNVYNMTKEQFCQAFGGIAETFAQCNSYNHFCNLSKIKHNVSYTKEDINEKYAADPRWTNFADPYKGTYRILNAMPNELHYLEPYKRVYRDLKRGVVKTIPTAYNLVNNTGSKAAVHVYAYCDSCQHKGRVMVTQKREASMADIIKGTNLSKRSVVNALNVLSDIGYMRAYKDAQDSRIQHYRINPVYWDISKAREIDWIDWILFADVLTPLVAGRDLATSFAFRELCQLAYYHAFPYELEKLKLESSQQAQQQQQAEKAEDPAPKKDLFDLAPAPAAKPETVAAPAEEPANTKLDSLAVASAAVVEDPTVSAFIDSLDWDKLDAVQEKAKVEPKIEHKALHDTYTDEQRTEIYDRLILHHEDGKPYNYLTIGKSGNMVYTRTWDEEKDMYFQVNTDSEAFVAKKYSASEIDTVNAYYIDIDGGKDDNGKYWGEFEIAARKRFMRTCIASLPAPTLVVETRNGYHVYWSIAESERHDLEKWQKVEAEIHKRVIIMDSKVKDISRILRVPNSVWHKPESGYPAYRTTINYASDTVYTAEIMLAALDEKAQEYTPLVTAYNEKYPKKEENSNNKKNHKGMAAPRAHVEKIAINPGNVSPLAPVSAQIINAIRAKKPIRVAGYDSVRTVEDVIGEIKKVDIADFFGIDNPRHFSDLFHVDRNPSAYIAEDKTRPGTYKYFCASATSPAARGWDLIDMVQWIQNTDQRSARKYIQRCLNIKGIKKLQKVG